MRILAGYQKPPTSLAVSADGSRLYSHAEGHSAVWQWDLAAGTVEKKWRPPQARANVALVASPQGAWMVSVAWGRTKREAWISSLDGAALAPKALPELHSPEVTVHAGSRLVACTARTSVRLWDLTRKARFTTVAEQLFSILALAFSPDGDLLATAAQDKTVRPWDHRSGKGVRHLDLPDTPLRLTFRPDGGALVVGCTNVVHVLDLKDGRLIHSLRGHAGRAAAEAYSPDGKFFATAGAEGAVCLYDADTCEQLGKRHLNIGRLGALCWLPDSSGVAVGGPKPIAICTVEHLHGTEHARPKPRGEPLSLESGVSAVHALAYSPDGRSLVGSPLCMWDLSGGAGQARRREGFAADRLRFPGPSGVWSPDGRRLAVALDFQRAGILDADTGAVLREFSVDRCPVDHLVFVPGGLVLTARGNRHDQPNFRHLEWRDAEGALISTHRIPGEAFFRGIHVCADRAYLAAFGYVRGAGGRFRGVEVVYSWRYGSDELAELFRPDTATFSVSVSEDGRRIVTVGGSTAAVRPLDDVKSVLPLKHPLACTGAAFLPGGRLLTSCYDGIVRGWDLSGGAELFALDLGMGRAYSLAVSPDHMTFAVGVQKGGRVVLMDVPD